MIKPIKEIYDNSVVASSELMEESKLIEKLLIFGTNLLKWEMDSAKEAAKFPLIFQLRRTLEILDSIQILIKHSNSSTLMILLRSQIESFFYIEYLIREETQKRGIAYNYWHLKEMAKNYERLIPGTELYKQLQSHFRKDTSGNFQFDISSVDPEKSFSEIQSILNNEIFFDIKEEENRLKAENIKNPKWYQFYNPKNCSLKELSSSLGFNGLYEGSYRLNSRSTHGNDSHEGYFKYKPEGKIELFNIRTPVMTLDCTKESSHYALTLYQDYIEKRLPEYSDEFNSWFNTEIEKLRGKILERNNDH